MLDTNFVFQVGNLVVTPTLRKTRSGTPVTNLLLANSHVYTNANGEKTRISTKHNVAVFGHVAEDCVKALRAGSQVVIEGRLETREKEVDGMMYTTTEIVANRVGFGPNPRDVEWVDEDGSGDTDNLFNPDTSPVW